MDKEYFDSLVNVRMERAKDLLEEAVELLGKGSCKCDLLEYLSQRAVISEVFCDGVG